LTAVVWERPSDLVTPVLAGLRLFRAGEPAYLLESAESGESVGRFSFLGFGVVDRLELRADEGAAALERLETFVKDHEVNPFVGPPTFPAGCVGYLGYDAIRLMEKIPRRHGAGSTPDVVLIHFRDHLVFDHLRRRVYLVTMVGAGERTEAAFEQAADRLQAMRTTLESGAMSPLRPSATTGPVEATPDAMTYRRQVGIAREYIARGDIFQVVLARQFRRPFDGDAFAVYRSLRAINPSPFQVFFDAGSHQLVGSSPEDLVRIHGDRIETLPIAGTRKRGESSAADQALERELLADPKERAEHTMLVDLARNDIGRVSEPGTVRVDELMKIQRYSHVMHIVSGDCGPTAAWCGPCFRAFRPERSAARPRSGPWRSSTNRNPSAAAPTPAPSATSTAAAILTAASPSAPSCWTASSPPSPPAQASWPTPTPRPKNRRPCTRRPPCWPRWKWPENSHDSARR
jgi:anthranilate synthase component 1